MRSIAYTSAARRQLGKLPQNVQAQVLADLSRYAETGQGDVLKMQGRENLWRLRSGVYRVVFVLTPNMVGVEEIAHRKDIYR